MKTFYHKKYFCARGNRGKSKKRFSEITLPHIRKNQAAEILFFQFRNAALQSAQKFLASNTFAKAREKTVFACHSPENLVEIHAVERVADWACMPWECLYHSDVSRSLDAYISAQKVLHENVLAFLPLFFSGKRVGVAAVSVRDFSHFQKLEVARKRRLRHFESFVIQKFQQRILAFDSVRLDYFSDCLKPSVAFFQNPPQFYF